MIKKADKFAIKSFIRKALIMLIPLTIQGMMDNAISLVNTFLCGTFNDPNSLWTTDDIVAGIGSQTNVFEIVWYGLIGIVLAGNIFSSQYYGAGRIDKVKESMNAKLTYMIIFAVLCSVIVELAAKGIIQAIIGGAGAESSQAVSVGVYYTRIAALSYIFLSISYCFAMTMNAIGKIKITLISSGLGLIVYLAIACTFSFLSNISVESKVTGLAIAVISAWFTSTLIYIIYFIIKKPPYSPNLIFFKISREMHLKILKTAAPIMLTQMALGFSLVFQIAIFSTYGGATSIAALQIVLTIFSLLSSIFRPLSGLVAFYIGLELGANRLDSAKINSWRIIWFFLFVVSILSLFFFSMAFWLPQKLYPNLSEESRNVAIWYLYFAPVSFFGQSFIQLFSLILNAGGFQNLTSSIILIMQWILDVLLIFLMFKLQKPGTAHSIRWLEIVLAMGCLIKLVESVIMFIFFKFIKWNRNLIDEQGKLKPKIITQPTI